MTRQDPEAYDVNAHMPTVTIDGKTVTVEPGTNLIQAAEKLGIDIPYYCYHPGLSIAGNCRMCLVKMEKSPKPIIACQTLCQDGMVIDASSEEVGKLRQAVLEFLLINHPLDCPVCDQAGECWLQDYYMEFGLYDPKFNEQKVKKHYKATPIGPHVMLDSERCILCSRCARFTDEISKTHELGIFDRGDHSEIGIYPGKELNNSYSGNVVDICPVGALTDRDFRFKCRVWYLKSTPSVCPGCSNGCNIQMDVNKDRPHHAKGERVMRLKPRYNAAVNQWWICDAGRYGYKSIDQGRMLLPQKRRGTVFREEEWGTLLEDLASELATLLKRNGKESLGVFLSPQLSNEDLFIAKIFFEEYLGLSQIALLSPHPEGNQDAFLIRSDKNPNTRGVLAMGLSKVTADTILQAIQKGSVKGAYLFGQDLYSLFGEKKFKETLERLELIVFQGTHPNKTSEKADFLLPSATYAEKEGTFTNYAGRVQRFWKALEPLGGSLPDTKILQDLGEKMGKKRDGETAEAIFSRLAKSLPAFRGLSYASLGETGALLSDGGK